MVTPPQICEGMGAKGHSDGRHLCMDRSERLLAIPAELDFQLLEPPAPHESSAGQSEDIGGCARVGSRGGSGTSKDPLSLESSISPKPYGPMGRNAKEALARLRTVERTHFQAGLRVRRAEVALYAAQRDKQAQASSLAAAKRAVLDTEDTVAIAYMEEAHFVC